MLTEIVDVMPIVGTVGEEEVMLFRRLPSNHLLIIKSVLVNQSHCSLNVGENVFYVMANRYEAHCLPS
jgi:hypothetical protein